jgi:ATP-binding cassette, subfamily B, bacterial
VELARATGLSFIMKLHLPFDFARARGRAWLSIARLLPLAGWPVLACSALISLTIGLLPLAFIAGTSVMLQRLAGPGGLTHRPRDWAAVLTVFALAMGALVIQNVLSPVQTALGELVTRRVDGCCIRRLMRAGLCSAPMALLEQQDVLEQLSLARRGLTERWQTPGAAVAGLIALVPRYAQNVGAIVLVGLVLGPLAGLVLGLTAAVIRLGSRGSLSRFSMAVRDSLLGPKHRLRYVMDMGSDVGVAKEVRVLGILPWLRHRSEEETRACHEPLWRVRRRIYFTPFLVFTAAMLAGTVAVLALLRADVAAGTVSVLGLSLAIQAILIPLRMGTFFPESDVQTMSGMLVYDSIIELEARFRALPAGADTAQGRPVVGRRLPAAGLPRAAVRFEDVRFSYPGGPEILSGLNLEFQSGTSTAIVGLNGSGKTTLVKLLAGLYQPTSGRISVDGTDLRELDPRGWQRRLAVIFQDYVRYQLDAAANIGLGAPGSIDDHEALRAAADWADAGDILDRLPAGLATPLSSRYAGGVDLSGGQWQRIALARALFAVGAGAPVLVLDEPTTQLDVRAEVAFFDRFLQLTSGLTTVVISHRFSTVRRADRIVFLARGRIAEEGSHDELLRRGGRYAELFHLQARRFTPAETEDDVDAPTRSADKGRRP